MNKRVAIYARFSSINQREASLEDQLRICMEKAKEQGWEIYKTYKDAAISGASMHRSGIQNLMQAAMNGEFDIILAEALDRLSRDQGDIAGLFKRMEFAGIKIITLAEGEISSLHIGLKGTMNSLFIKDLAEKTHRGLRGRIEKGKSGGGIAYGYKVVKCFDANGEAIKGDREINEAQAKIIRRIFNEYAYQNKSPKAIAAQLNKEGIPGPSGKSWGQSSINGNRKRGTGILNNEMYIGQLIWNRQRFVKNPDTGKRVAQINDEAMWIRQELPELRIIDQKLWNAAKKRQSELDREDSGLWNKKRPQYLLSGLAKCGICGGGYSKINKFYYGCSASKNKGEALCDNRKTIKREILETFVLDAMQTRLMQDELVEIFCEEYTNHMDMLHKKQNSAQMHYKSEQAKLEKEKENIIQAIKDGLPGSMFKDELEKLECRTNELKSLTSDQSGPKKAVVQPCMASRYRKGIGNLRKLLNKDSARAEASHHLRTLIDKIVLTPKNGNKDLSIDLYGDLAGILSIAQEDSTMNSFTKIKKPQKLPSNGNRAGAFQDKIGSGDRI